MAIGLPRGWQVENINGTPVSGAKIYTWVDDGVTTPRSLYTDKDCTVPAANPIVADSAGWWNVYQKSSESVHIVVKSADDSITYTQKTYPSAIDNAQPVDATLTALAGLTIADGKIIRGTGADAFEVIDQENIEVIPAGGSTARTLANWTSQLMEFHDTDYIAAAQMAYIRGNDASSQTAATVTSGLQAMHDAMMTAIKAAKAAGINITVKATYIGTYAVNDEIFSETFAEDYWNLGNSAECRFIFDFTAAVLKVSGWASHKGVRTSGIYADLSISDAVPKAVIRLEADPAAKRPFVDIIGGLIVGEGTTTDPIGIKLMNPNRMNIDDTRCFNLRNTARWIEGANNMEMHSGYNQNCGWQPTEFGGNGFISSSVTFSCTAGGSTTTITASSAIFDDPTHVGMYFFLQGAGSGGTCFVGDIASVDSATQITVNGVATTNVTGKYGSFGILRGSISADGTSLTISNTVSTDLVGRYVCIWGAGSKVYTTQDVLVTRVTAQSGTTITLATAARNTVSDVPVCLAPTDYIGRSDDFKTSGGAANAAQNNDTQWFGYSSEFYSGTWGSCIQSVFQATFGVQTFGRKAHGSTSTYGNNFAAGAAICWFDHCTSLLESGPQYEYNDNLPDYGRLMFSGATTHVEIHAMEMGQAESDHAGMFYVAPQAADITKTQISYSGKINQSSGTWGLTDQDFVRYGTYGRAAHLFSLAPVASNGITGRPFDMPRDFLVRKTADQTVNTSTTLVDCDDLTFAAAEGEKLFIEADIFYNSNTTADLQFKLVAPSGTTGKLSFGGPRTQFSGVVGGAGYGPVNNALSVGGLAADAAFRFTAMLTISSTAGDVKLQFAQSTSDASDTKILADSTFRVRRLL